MKTVILTLLLLTGFKIIKIVNDMAENTIQTYLYYIIQNAKENLKQLIALNDMT